MTQRSRELGIFDSVVNILKHKALHELLLFLKFRKMVLENQNKLQVNNRTSKLVKICLIFRKDGYRRRLLVTWIEFS